MKNKKYFLSSLGLAMVLGLVGCSGSTPSTSENPSSEPSQITSESTPISSETETPNSSETSEIPTSNYVKKVFPFRAADYGVELTNDRIDLYFDGMSLIPYIKISTFINSLDGYLISEGIHKEVITSGIKYSYKTSDGEEKYIIFDYKNNEITMTDDQFFHFDLSIFDFGYDSHIQEGKTHYLNQEPGITHLYLNRYGLDIGMIDDDALMPLSILSAIVFQPFLGNFYFNQKEVLFFISYTAEGNDWYNLLNKSLINSKIPQELCDYRYKEMCFLYDNYYGLGEGYDVLPIDTYLSKEDPQLKEWLTSSDPDVYENGLVEFYMLYLNDPHTSVINRSNYADIHSGLDVEIPLSYPNDFGPRVRSIWDDEVLIEKEYNKAFGKNNYRLYRTYNNTGVIKLQEFVCGTVDQTINKDGTIKSNAKYVDSFFAIKCGLDEFAKNPKIKNVVIDLTNNPGGEVDSAYAGLGLLTNRDIEKPFYERLSGNCGYSEYKVDCDLDGDFNDDDAYEQFNYYILTASPSYSSSLVFAGFAKDMGIATIIGQDVGGGMCGVSDFIFCDGSSVSYSGMDIAPGMKTLPDGSRQFYNVEYGLEVDYRLEYNQFYDLKFLDGWLKTLN